MMPNENQNQIQLNPHHHDQLVAYLRFASFQRHQSLVDIDLTFQRALQRQLGGDTTFTRDEVVSFVKELAHTVNADVAAELVRAAHTSAVLLRQYLQQAERWYLKMTCRIEEMENQRWLECIARFEESELSARPKLSQSHGVKLAPVADAAVTDLLQQEITRLRDENMALSQYKETIQAQILQEREKSNNEMKSWRENVDRLKQLLHEKDAQTKEEDSLTPTKSNPPSEQISLLERELQDAKENLSRLSQELDSRLHQSQPVQNLRKMLASKNEQLQWIKQQLQIQAPIILQELQKHIDECA